MRAGASFEAVQYSAGPGVDFSTTTYQSTEREHGGLRIRKVIGELLISIRPQEVRHEKTSPANRDTSLASVAALEHVVRDLS